MLSLQARLLAAELVVASPSGVLRLVGSGTGQLTVHVSRGALKGWTEAELEQEVVGTINAALRVARLAYHRVRREVLEDSRSEPADASQPEAAHTDSRRNQGAGSHMRSRPVVFSDAVKGIEVYGMSQREYVSVTRDRGQRFHVRVRPHTLEHLREDEVAQEIGSALAEALASFECGYAAAYRSAFGGDPDGSEWDLGR